MTDVLEKLEAGLAHQKCGRLDEAEQCYLDALRLEPQNGEALKLLALIAFRRGRFEDAVSHATAAAASNPSNGKYWHLLGEAHLKLGDLDAAAVALRNAVDRNPPTRVEATLELINCHVLRKAWKDALAVAQGFLEEQPDHEAALRTAVDVCRESQLDREALTYVDRLLAIKPSDASAWHASAYLAANLGDRESAYTRAAAASRIEPSDRGYAYSRRALGTKLVPTWHFNMMNDASRNLTYSEGIARKIHPDQLVFEIGTGGGLLAMLAARCGASRVVTCEANSLLAEVAKENIAANHLSHIITVVPKRSTELVVGVDLPERADVLISEIFGSQLIDEDVLISLEDAKARLLKPGATIIPARATICGGLIASSTLAKSIRVDRVCGFDVSATNAFSPLVLPGIPPGADIKWLSEPIDLFNFDFQNDDSFPTQKREINVEVTSAGLCHGVIQWLRVDFDEAASFENTPGTGELGVGHWSPNLFTFATPVQLQAGERVRLEVFYARSALRVDFVSVQ